MKMIDISRNIFTSPVEEGKVEPRLQKVRNIEAGDDANETAIYASLQTGSYVLAPSHIFEEEDEMNSIGDYPIDTFVGPVTVVDVPPGPLTGREIELYFPQVTDRVIIRCAGDYQFFAGAADDLAELGYKLIGYEGSNHGGFDEAAFKRSILSSGAVILEGLDLSGLKHGGQYYLMAQPLATGDTESAPCRAVLLENI